MPVTPDSTTDSTNAATTTLAMLLGEDDASQSVATLDTAQAAVQRYATQASSDPRARDALAALMQQTLAGQRRELDLEAHGADTIQDVPADVMTALGQTVTLLTLPRHCDLPTAGAWVAAMPHLQCLRADAALLQQLAQIDGAVPQNLRLVSLPANRPMDRKAVIERLRSQSFAGASASAMHPDLRPSAAGFALQERSNSIEDLASQLESSLRMSSQQRHHGFLGKLLKAMTTIAKMELVRSNRPDIRQRMMSNPHAVSSTLGIAQTRVEHFDPYFKFNASIIPDPRERRDRYARFLASFYQGTKGLEAFCDEHAAIVMGLLLNEGVPSAHLLMLGVNALTPRGRNVGHTLLVYCKAGFGPARLGSPSHVMNQAEAHVQGYVVVDPWARNKFTVFPGNATGEDFRSHLQQAILDIAPVCDMRTLNFFEAWF
jgi:hypothetical protein